MSAENRLDVYRMSNGQYWIAMSSFGSVADEDQGAIQCVVAKLNSYAEARDEMAVLDNPDSDRYVYTEYGCGYLSESEPLAGQIYFAHSLVCVEFARKNGYVTQNDLQKKQWRVTESDMDTRVIRVLADNLWYPQAITLANFYAKNQPGEVELALPKMFYRRPRKGEGNGRYSWEGAVMDLPPRK